VRRETRMIPGLRGRALFLLPEIADDDPPDRKNALALRNACSVAGECPSCGAIGETYLDREIPELFHLVFRHEPECLALTDDVA
jgi:hypothetical protein